MGICRMAFRPAVCQMGTMSTKTSTRKPHPDAARWAVVGGGVLGLTLARRLRARGHAVTVFESAPELGGLASAWQLHETELHETEPHETEPRETQPRDAGHGCVTWDRHYHVTLLSDAHTRSMLRDLDLEHTVKWVITKTGVFGDGHLYSVSNALEFLRFPLLRLQDKVRLGATIAAGARMTDWRRLEQIPVETFLRRWSGDRTFDRFWKPLLRAKLGDRYKDASAAFIWATIARLYAARRGGHKVEMFGYVPGGYARVFERFGERLAADGVEVRTSARVESVDRTEGGLEIVMADGARHAFDKVVVTAASPVAARLCPVLPAAERDRLAAVQYHGIVCASLLLERPLADFYVTNLTDDWVPFTGVIEMTALVDRAEFAGRALVYLPKYTAPDDPFLALDDAEVEARFVAALERMYPHFRRDQVRAFRVSRVRYVFPVPTLGYSTRVPPMKTSVPGLFTVNSAQIVNGTLNVNETVQLAERAMPVLLG